MSTRSAPADLRVQLDHVQKRYAGRSGDVEVLTDVCLELVGGADLAIQGPSGSGKSTLLHLLGGLDPPTAGKILVDGQDPYALTEPELARFRNRTIGFVFQDHHLLPQCSVIENVLVPTLAGDGVTEEAEARAVALLDRVGLSHRFDHLPAELSGGERQRVAICRALLMRPTLLLCDEPTGNLDRHSAENVADLLLEMFREDSRFLIVVTHSSELASRLSCRMVLRDGRLVQE